MMYSVRDSKFYLHIYRGRIQEYEGSPLEDLVKATTSSGGFPPVSLYKSFPISDILKSRQDGSSQITSLKNWLSPPEGDHFVVHWCYEPFPGERLESKTPPSGISSSYRKKAKSFMVFRQDPEQKISSYTEDISDLCIFVGESEAFCVSATEYPGLKPNSVYYAGYSTGFSFYDPSFNTLHDLTDEAVASSLYMWLAPLQ